MHSRSKVFAIESVSVMLVLILFAFVVFLLISSGSHAYDHIIDQKKATESSRVAYSYINMKIKQNDTAGSISVAETSFGNALKINLEDSGYCTYIFYANGGLYECLTLQEMAPSVDAANLITNISRFELQRDGALLRIWCESQSGEHTQVMEGVVSLRT
jgi:hypothetical protein